MKKVTMLLALLLTLLSACSENIEEAGGVTKEIKVKTALMPIVDVTRYHHIPAIIVAENRARLAFQLSGTVEKVLVKIGEKVAKGQVLMSLYNPNIDPALKVNLANLESIKTQIDQVKRDVANLKQLRVTHSASKTAFEQKETGLKNLHAKKKSIQAQLDLALANQTESFIHAPFNCTVVAVDKQVGEFVSSGQVVMEVNQEDGLETEVHITKSIRDNLSINDVVIGNYENKQVELIVSEISQAADAKSHLSTVILHLNTAVKNAIGQQVILQFPEIIKSVYQMPLEIVVDDGINKPYIFSLVNGIAKKNYIHPLYIEKGNIIFTLDKGIEGLVVTKGQSRISEGMKLTQ